MRLEIDVNMQYMLGDASMVLLVIEAARMEGQTVLREQLEIADAMLTRIGGEGGVGQRVWAQVATEQMSLRYNAEVEITRPLIPLESLGSTPIHALPGDILTYLRPSRFCQSDLFQDFTAQNFGALEGGRKMSAIRDWVASEIRYVPASSNPDTTVVDTFSTMEGVCRDYAHLVCALARAADIPARYASVYGPGVDPQDFHAVAQVWLEGGWHIVDATGMGSASDLVLIAVGRDAYDIAFMETRSLALMVNQSVKVQRLY
jgi:transglutaminase-like putative cysteine protease